MIDMIEENLILKNLVTNEQYFDKVFPFLKKEFFRETYTKKIFNCIKEYNEKYSKKATISVMRLFADQVKGVSMSEYAEIQKAVEYYEKSEDTDFTWLCDCTEDFIKKRLYEDAISEAADKYEKNDLDYDLPEKITDALSVTFDNEIGMDFSDADKRWDIYTTQEDRIPFLVDKLNEITKGGLTRKTLNCLMSANTGGFKSGTMCSLSSDYLRQGYNVLYLTFEMDEAHIMERIDANLLDTDIDDIVKMGKDAYITKIAELKNKCNGRFIVKQYPTSMCHVGHIRYLLKELKLKKKFIPDIIMLDYIGIMASIRYSHTDKEYSILKSIVEEVRGVCVEYNVVGWTAMQSNRQGATAGVDLSISDVSSSYGTVYGFDLLLGIITSPEFDADHKISFKQLKNRYSDMNLIPKFMLGLNKARMKVYNITTGVDSFNVPKDAEEQKNEDDAERSVFVTRFKTAKKTNSTNFVFTP